MDTTQISIQEAREKGIPLPTLLKASIAAANEKKTAKKQSRPKSTKSAKYTVSEAFDYFFHGQTPSKFLDDLNSERALRAVAFLLHWQSDIGNKHIDGHAANGLGFILEEVAKRTAAETAYRQQEAGSGD